MGLTKVLSAFEILVLVSKQALEAIDLNVVVKDAIQSARLGGFGNADLAVELFIQERDYGKAHPIIEEFRMSL